MAIDPLHPAKSSADLRGALTACRAALGTVGLLSAGINVLYLTGSIFMLEVYDRVLPSHSVPTLVALVLMAALLYAFQGLFDIVRGRLLIRIGASLDARMSGRAFEALVQTPMRLGPAAETAQPVRDLDQIKAFLSGAGPAAFFDVPWMPLYVGICYAFHPLIGYAAMGGSVLLIALMVVTEVLTRSAARHAARAAAARAAFADNSRRNAEVLQAMGMGASMAEGWRQADLEFRRHQLRTADVATVMSGVSKVTRTALQSGVLALGAYLVIQQQATSGIIIASSILTSRALAPVEQVIANWKGFVAMRQSWGRLADLLTRFASPEPRMSLPAPRLSLEVQGLGAAPPGGARPVVRGVSFHLRAGQALGVIGTSASGKSSLARLLVGAWRAGSGVVRLDGAALEQWPADELGRHIGYLPQDVELFPGSVESNIARFEANRDPADVIKAASLADVHELILRLPHGYQTEIGTGGAVLSAGQRQRIALARALYKDPFLVVLDEPNSNLDHDGEEALTRAILKVRERGGVVVIIAHRHSALAAADMVLGLADGRMAAFGPKEETLTKLLRPASSPPPGREPALRTGGHDLPGARTFRTVAATYGEP